MLSYEITTELTKKLKKVSDLASDRVAFLKGLNQEARDAVHRYARISSIGATTRIENAILTDSEIDWLDETLSQDGRPTSFLDQQHLIENKLSKEKERSIEEVAGSRGMLTLVYAQAQEWVPLTESTIRGLHQELLQFYPPASHYLGAYKTAPNSVVEKVGATITRVVLKTADPGPITQAAMRDLLQWYRDALSDHPWSLAVACELVFRFLAIHPFQDGNGRVGRGLFLLALLQSPDTVLRSVIPFVAVDRHIEKNKEEYYLVLRKCSGGIFSQDPQRYHIEHFLRFMLKMMEEALNQDIIFYAKKYQAFVDLAPAPRQVLQCFREHPEQRMMSSDLASQTGVPRRTVIHAVNQLVRGGFLQKYGRGPGTRYQLTF